VNTVRVVNVRHRFGSTIALDGAEFDLAPGITGLLGPNGAGKTTLLRCLATVLAPDGGDLEVLGFDPLLPTERTEIRRRLGYMPQEAGFYKSFTTFEFLDYLAILKEMVDRTARHAEVRRVLGAVGLTERSTAKIRKLSGGMKRRLLLAQALLGEPQLLILDEPTAGLDPEQRFRFREMISQFAAERIVLLSTHQTEDVSAICDTVVVLNGGRVTFRGTPRQLIDIADGHVWLADQRPPTAHITWRTAEGRFRAVGDPPPGAEMIAPTIEDGYLLLVGAAAIETERVA